MQSLLNYINRHVPNSVSDYDMALIENAFILKKIKKKQYFLQEGEICDHIGFVVKGAFRQFFVDGKGGENVIYLFIENYWISDIESVTKQTPTKYNIQAWEDSELLVIKRADLLELMKKIPAFIEMFRLLHEMICISNQRRLSSAISKNADKQYEELSKNYPKFIERFPQHIIASFLGITKETLSRVRKNT
jgi:CRP-like cAMP-binding protein